MNAKKEKVQKKIDSSSEKMKDNFQKIHLLEQELEYLKKDIECTRRE